MKNLWTKRSRKNFCSNDQHYLFNSRIKKSVRREQRQSDLNRQNKLNRLIQGRSDNPQYNKSKVHNLSSCEIPAPILKTLELGHRRAIGGMPSDSSNQLAIGKLFEEFQERARQNGISEIDIQVIRSHCVLAAQTLSHCFTDDPQIKSFLEFQKKHPDIVFIPVDKSEEICILDKNEYFEKLKDLFLNKPEFEKVNLKLDKEIKAYLK